MSVFAVALDPGACNVRLASKGFLCVLSISNRGKGRKCKEKGRCKFTQGMSSILTKVPGGAAKRRREAKGVMNSPLRHGFYTRVEDNSEANEDCSGMFMEMYSQHKPLSGTATTTRNQLKILSTERNANVAAGNSSRVCLSVCHVQLTDQGLISRMRVKWRPKGDFSASGVFLLH